MSTRLAALCVSLTILAPGCDADLGHRHQELPAYAGTFKYQDVDLPCDVTFKNDIRIGSRRHIYSFFAEADQKVRFELELREPESTGRGAELWLFDDSGSQLGHVVDWYGTTVTLDASFVAAGEYLLYVSQADFWGLDYDSTYPYRLTPLCASGLCAQVTLALSEEAWPRGYFVKNFPWHQEEAAWSWYPGPNPDMTIIDHDVTRARCNDIVDDSCTPAEPAICCGGLDFYGPADNVCAFRNYLHGRAGFLGMDAGGYHPGECE